MSRPGYVPQPRGFLRRISAVLDGRLVHYSTSSANRYAHVIATLYRQGAKSILVTDRTGAIVLKDSND